MNSTRSLVRRTVAGVAAAAAAVVLAACGTTGGSGTDGHSAPSHSPSASASGARQNAADVSFAKGMIPHHRQAVEMAALAPSRAGSAQVEKLAEEIEKAQGPEIRTLTGWLASWGEEPPAAGAMDHSAHGGTGGMMAPEEMDRLEGSSGEAFDSAFMELMIKHHEGAVVMARKETADGVFPDARAMAEDIVTSQTVEITEMEKLLGTR